MKIKRVILCLIAIIIVSFGAAVTLKAAIGVGAWDALAQSGSEATGIKVGTIGMVLNFICVLIELIILKRDFKINHLIQILICFIIGYSVNFFYYDVLENIELSSYYMGVILLVLGYVINGFAVGIVMLLDVVTFPLEGACMAVSGKTKFQFHKIRQGLDIIFIIITIIITFIFNVPLAIREGTIIGMLIFGPVMGFFMKLQKPYLKKYNFID